MTFPGGGNHGKGDGDRQSDIVDQRGRRRAGAAFAAIDLYVVRATFRMRNAILKPRLQEFRVASDELYPNRLAGDVPHALDKLA